MFGTPSLLGPLNSGYVDFASGAPIESLAESEARDVVAPGAPTESLAESETRDVIARVSAAPVVDAREETREDGRSAVWAPASSARIRVVEALVVAAICAYFAFGLARTLTGF